MAIQCLPCLCPGSVPGQRSACCCQYHRMSRCRACLPYSCKSAGVSAILCAPVRRSRLYHPAATTWTAAVPQCATFFECPPLRSHRRSDLCTVFFTFVTPRRHRGRVPAVRGDAAGVCSRHELRCAGRNPPGRRGAHPRPPGKAEQYTLASALNAAGVLNRGATYGTGAVLPVCTASPLLPIDSPWQAVCPCVPAVPAASSCEQSANAMPTDVQSF